MHALLRDWDRNWYLAFSTEVGHSPGRVVPDIRIAHSTLARLLRDAGNRSAVRVLLSSEIPALRGIPTQLLPLLGLAARRMEKRVWALRYGEKFELRSGGSSAPSENPLTAFDFPVMHLPDEGPEAGSGAAVPESEAAVPALRFSGEHERPDFLRFEHGAEKEAGMVFAHGAAAPPAMAFGHGSEEAPGLAFAHAAEGSGTVGFSASVKAPFH